MYNYEKTNNIYIRYNLRDYNHYLIYILYIFNNIINRFINYYLFHMETTKEKEIWELNQDELLEYIYKVNKRFLCINKEQFDFWEALLYEKLPLLKDIKIKPEQPSKYPCTLEIHSNTHDSLKFDTYDFRNDYIYVKYARTSDYSNYPYQGLNGWDICYPFIACPENLNVCSSTDEVEQYKHKLLNQQL